jgi:hypothetical protein
MGSEQKSDQKLKISRTFDPVTLAGGYTTIYFIPVEFNQELNEQWVVKLKKKYDELSQGKTESIVFQPVGGSPLLDWANENVDAQKLLFIMLNKKTGPEGTHVEPEPEKALNWLTESVNFANEADN